jgi:hypothetical protein
MTPFEELEYLRSAVAKHPQARLGKTFDRLRILAKADELKSAQAAEYEAKRMMETAGATEGLV